MGTTNTMGIITHTGRASTLRCYYASCRIAQRWITSWSSIEDRPSWSPEWKRLGLGATLVDAPQFPPNLFFVQMGFGVDQHGDPDDATKAAVRAVRNAIEFNSIPGVISHLPGGRKNMLIHVKLGIPSRTVASTGDGTVDPQPMALDELEVAKVFPYGKVLPFEMTIGGLKFHTGRVVEELGDTDDVGVCVAACVSLGYKGQHPSDADHTTCNTNDGY